MVGQTLTRRARYAKHKLHPKEVETLGPRLKRNPSSPDDYTLEYIMYDGGGLCLIVRLTKDRQSVTKTFEFRYKSKVTGKEEKIRLGSYPALSLKAARIKAEDYSREHAEGIDPKIAIRHREEERQIEAARSNATFRKLADEWFDEYRPHWGDGHSERIQGMLKNHIFPKKFGAYVFGDQPIHHIKYEWVSDIVKRCAKTSPGVAPRVRGTIRKVFEHAVDMGKLPASQNFMAISPNIGGGKLGRDSISYPAIIDHTIFRELLISLDSYEGRGPIVSACLRLLPLLAQRPGQVAHMRWEALDLDAAIWNVSGTARKMKSQAAKKTAPVFVVPLPKQAVAIFRELQAYTGCNNGYVFLGQRKGRPISENTLNTALRSIGWRTKDTGECSEYEQKRIHCAHGFRTSFLTLTQDFFGSGVAASADRHLGHAPKIPDAESQLGSLYNKATLLDERTILVQIWADALDKLKAGTNPLRRDEVTRAVSVKDASMPTLTYPMGTYRLVESYANPTPVAVI